MSTNTTARHPDLPSAIGRVVIFKVREPSSSSTSHLARSAIGVWLCDILNSHRPEFISYDAFALPVEVLSFFDAGARGPAFWPTALFRVSEPLGVPDNHPLIRWGQRSFHSKNVLRPSRCRGPGEYSRALGDRIRGKGLGLSVLTVGQNGRLGGNEPGDCALEGDSSQSRIVSHSSATLVEYGEWLGPNDPCPVLSVTLGLADIIGARHTVLHATRAREAEPIARLLEGDIKEFVPDSPVTALLTCSKVSVQVLLSEEAARKLKYRERYEVVEV